jgi:hypothetical protein
LFPTRITGTCARTTRTRAVSAEVAKQGKKKAIAAASGYLWGAAFLASVSDVAQPVRDTLGDVLRVGGVAQAHDVGRAQLLVHLMLEPS